MWRPSDDNFNNKILEEPDNKLIVIYTMILFVLRPGSFSILMSYIMEGKHS